MKHWFWCGTPAPPRPECRFCAHTCNGNKQAYVTCAYPLEYTHYEANDRIFWQTTVLYGDWTLASSCSRKKKKSVRTELMAWEENKQIKLKQTFDKFSPTILWRNGSESSLWSSSSRLVISTCPNQQPSNLLPGLSTHPCSPVSTALCVVSF